MLHVPNALDSKDNFKYDKNHRVRAGNFSIKTIGVWDWVVLVIICHVKMCCNRTTALSVLYALTVDAF